MRTQRLKLENIAEKATSKAMQWLKDEINSVFKSNKDFTRKADYIGLTAKSMDTKIKTIDEDIKEMQELKKKLKASKELFLQASAEVMQSHGIDKIEGLHVSSLTLTKPSTKTTTKLVFTEREYQLSDFIDADWKLKELCGDDSLTLTKLVIDEDAVREILLNADLRHVLDGLADLEITTIETPSKLKVNNRRASKENKEPLYVELPEDKIA